MATSKYENLKRNNSHDTNDRNKNTKSTSKVTSHIQSVLHQPNTTQLSLEKEKSNTDGKIKRNANDLEKILNQEILSEDNKNFKVCQCRVIRGIKVCNNCSTKSHIKVPKNKTHHVITVPASSMKILPRQRQTTHLNNGNRKPRDTKSIDDEDDVKNFNCLDVDLKKEMSKQIVKKTLEIETKNNLDKVKKSSEQLIGFGYRLPRSIGSQPEEYSVDAFINEMSLEIGNNNNDTSDEIKNKRATKNNSVRKPKRARISHAASKFKTTQMQKIKPPTLRRIGCGKHDGKKILSTIKLVKNHGNKRMKKNKLTFIPTSKNIHGKREAKQYLHQGESIEAVQNSEQNSGSGRDVTRKRELIADRAENNLTTTTVEPSVEIFKIDVTSKPGDGDDSKKSAFEYHVGDRYKRETRNEIENCK